MEKEMYEAILNGTLVDYLLKNSKPVDEEFKEAEEKAIEKLKVEKKENFFDYYEDVEDKKDE